MNRTPTIFFGLLFVSACLVAVLGFHEVSNVLSEEDRVYVRKFLVERGVPALPNQRSYQQELAFIVQAQKAVLDVASGNDGIPFDAQREPKQLYQAKSGLCYDRSRVIEKIFRSANFRTRHISLYSTEQTRSAVKSLITPGVPSHAISEVLTSKGWLVVDSNDQWVSLDRLGNPVSIEDIQRFGARAIQWRSPVPSDFYEKPFMFVYGLYSRHGRFYPPYGFLPDVNYGELVQNVMPAP